jgi:3-oxoacyl-[acyl-carrier-protein] synthase II
VVTGLGVVSAAGYNPATYWEALHAGVCAARQTPIAGLSGIAPYEAAIDDGVLADQLAAFDVEAPDRVVQLGVLACRQAWQDAGFDRPAPPELAGRAGAILGSGLGGIQFQETQMWRVLRSREPRIHPHTAPRVCATAILTEIAQAMGLHGPGHVVNSACASSAHAIGQAMRAIRFGEADVMVAGGAEAPLSYFSLLAFGLLGVLSHAEGPPSAACKPFDRRRDGFVLGEGAAALVLEEADHARRRGAAVRARILGYGQSLGAYHPVHARPDGEDAAQAMRAALRDADRAPGQVGYVNAHGTATRENDLAEARAMRRVFGPTGEQPRISSIKPVTGHTLGAAGALEAVATVKALEAGVMPPNPNLVSQDPECALRVATEPTPFPSGTRLAMSSSFGFGNVNVSLIFERTDA